MMKDRTRHRTTLILLIALTMLTPSTLGSIITHPSTNEESALVSKISRQIALPPSSDYIVAFNATTLALTPEAATPAALGLSDAVIAAVAKAPIWVQRDLIRQFHSLPDPQPYADLLINTSRHLCDEITFSLAECPRGKIPTPALLLENAQALYDHDQDLQYVTIKDYDNGDGNYYSTLQYNILRNGTAETILLPPQIYYWYVVHPKLTLGDIDATYGSLWRSYVFNHNDLGYPLLKEKLANIQYLWDNESYYEAGNRLWTPSIQAHPTAIEAVSYWVGKTVPNQAVGDRPGKPSIIAHEHNGWCGELQSIAVAAQRAALIPSIPACNVGEDHVWREFYEHGWHENDNWWSDSGGAVDEPDVYAYGWGKNMSAIYTWRGDDTIKDDTSRYIHPDDRITVSFHVVDAHMQPVDGARVVVLVTGPKDITYYKNLVWGKIQAIWDRLPPILKGRLLTRLFDRVHERFNAIPGEIQGATITTWNYTDLDGRCSFQLGKNIEYLFLIQAGNLKKPWQLARHNTLRSLDTHADRSFTILMPDFSRKPARMVKGTLPSGELAMHLRFSTSASQQQLSFFSNGVGSQEIPGRLSCFLVDAGNLAKYQEGKLFRGYPLVDNGLGNLSVATQLQDWFLVFRNPAETTSVVLDFSLEARAPAKTDYVHIVTPDTTLFASPIFEIGDTVAISGVSSGPVTVFVGCGHYALSPVDGIWTFAWNASCVTPGRFYPISAFCGNATDTITVYLQDRTPPLLTVLSPVQGTIINRRVLNISGSCQDAGGIDRIDVRVDNGSWVTANGTSVWSGSWDGSNLSLGDHVVEARAVDVSGLASVARVWFAVNESGHTWGPEIHQVVVSPVAPVNTSNIVAEANVTSGSPFRLASVVFWYAYDGVTFSCPMYRYADSPVQARHEEDPLRNLSNLPVYGYEVGQLPTGTTVSYWVVALDSGGNRQVSSIGAFNVTR
jgi:hypothetical protein